MTDIKKYLPFIAIGAVVIWLVLKLSKSGSDSQVVNRVIPVQGEDNSVALKQIDAQFALGKLQLDSEAALAGKSIDAEKQRLDFQNRALELTSATQLRALDLQSQRDTNLAAIARDSTLADTNLRFNAAQELGRQNRNDQLLSQLLGLGSGFLQQLLKGGQQQSQSKPSSGGGSSGSGSPSQQQTVRRSQPVNYGLLERFFSRYANNANVISGIENSSLAGQYASYLDLQPYYDNEANAYDNWLDFGNGGINDPIGTVSIGGYSLYDSESPWGFYADE